jgi:O-antigen/teichoic acid export membrane protein
MSSLSPTPGLGGRFVRDSAWAFVGRASFVGGSLIVNVLLARILRPEELGVWFLLAGIVTLTALLAQLGSHGSVIRFIAESLATGKTGRARSAIRTSIAITLAGSLLASVAFAVLVTRVLAPGVFDSALMRDVALLAALLIPIYAFRQLMPQIFRGLHDMRAASLLGQGATAIALAVALAVVLVVYGSTDLRRVLLLAVGSGLVVVAISTAVLVAKYRRLAPGPPIAKRDVLSVNWPQFVTAIALAAATQTALFALGAARPADDVAIYGAAARLAAVLAVPLLIVDAVVAPMLADLYARGRRAELEQTLRASATIAMALTLVGAATLVLLGAPILGLVFGDVYREGVGVLVVLTVAQSFVVFSGSSETALFMTGHQRALMVVSIVGAVLAIPAYFVAANLGGLLGVALVSAGWVGWQNGATMLLTRRRAGVWTAADFSLRHARAMFGPLVR